MSDRSIRDGITLVAGFHFFLAMLCFVAVAGVFVYSIIPALGSGGGAQDIFLPIMGIIIGLLVMVGYALIGWGLMQFRNTARLAAIFMGALGVFGGFVGVLASIATNVIGQVQPDWISVILTAMALVCGYTLIGFMNIFILVFLFAKRVRAIFYGDVPVPPVFDQPKTSWPKPKASVEESPLEKIEEEIK